MHCISQAHNQDFALQVNIPYEHVWDLLSDRHRSLRLDNLEQMSLLKDPLMNGNAQWQWEERHELRPAIFIMYRQIYYMIGKLRLSRPKILSWAHDSNWINLNTVNCSFHTKIGILNFLYVCLLCVHSESTAYTTKLFMHFGCSLTRQQRFGGLKILTFENVFQDASFWKRYRYCLHVNYKNSNLWFANYWPGINITAFFSRTHVIGDLFDSCCLYKKNVKKTLFRVFLYIVVV